MARFFTKVAQIFGKILDNSEKSYFLNKHCCGSFWATFVEYWAAFV